MAEIQKQADQAERTSIQKTGEDAKEGGVIAGQKNQEVHGKAFEQAHKGDKTLSEPDMIAINDGETAAQYKARVAQIQANRFGFYDSEAEPKVYEKQASQALEPPPGVNLNDPEFQSSVKLNVQITNVPEVSEGVKPEEVVQHLNQVFEAGAQAVKPIKDWMATPNAVSDALVSIGPALDNAVNYYSSTPADQVKQDIGTLTEQAADALDKTFSYPLTSEERARITGNLLPMFFFEGNTKEPVHLETAQQLGLETMSESELKSLGISRTIQEISNLHMPEVPEHLKHLELQPATQELIDAIANRGIPIRIAEDAQDIAHLKSVEASAAYRMFFDGTHEIVLPQNAAKIQALEEFLHSTQNKLGFFEKGEIPRQIAEIHVKDFMIRHARLLGLDDNDLQVLRALKARAIEKADAAGYIWKE